MTQPSSTNNRFSARANLLKSRSLAELSQIVDWFSAVAVAGMLLGFGIRFHFRHSAYGFFFGDSLAQTCYSIAPFFLATRIAHWAPKRKRSPKAHIFMWIFFAGTLFAALFSFTINIRNVPAFGAPSFWTMALGLLVTVYVARTSYWVVRLQGPTQRELKRQDAGVAAFAGIALISKLSDGAVMHSEALSDLALASGCIALGLQFSKIAFEYFTANGKS